MNRFRTVIFALLIVTLSGFFSACTTTREISMVMLSAREDGKTIVVPVGGYINIILESQTDKKLFKWSPASYDKDILEIVRMENKPNPKTGATVWLFSLKPTAVGDTSLKFKYENEEGESAGTYEIMVIVKSENEVNQLRKEALENQKSSSK
jgi:hypothetical protein